MFKLPIKNHNGVPVMSSVDLAKICVGEKKDAHANFMKKAEKVSRRDRLVNFYEPQKYWAGAVEHTRNILMLPERESCLMAMSYSYELQAKVYDAWKALERQPQVRETYQPIAPVLKDLLAVAELCGKSEGETLLCASFATEKLTGLNPLELLEPPVIGSGPVRVALERAGRSVEFFDITPEQGIAITGICRKTKH